MYDDTSLSLRTLVMNKSNQWRLLEICIMRANRLLNEEDKKKERGGSNNSDDEERIRRCRKRK